KKGDDKKGEEKKPVVESNVDITNLLPNDADGVLLLNLKTDDPAQSFFPSSTLSSIVFNKQGGFNKDAFKEKFGFAPEAIKQAVVASSSKNAWAFSVLRVPEGVVKEQLVARLDLKPGPQKLDFEYFVTDSPLDELGTFLFKDQRNRTTAVHLYDDTTLVLGDVKPVEAFLTAKRQPRTLSSPDAAPFGGAMGQMGGVTGPPQGGQMGGVTGPPQGGQMGGVTGPPQGGQMGGVTGPPQGGQMG